MCDAARTLDRPPRNPEELHVRRGRGLQKRLERELDQRVDLDLSAGRVGW